MSEEWRPVTGWEDFYEVSDQGRVRSLDRLSRNGTTTYVRKGRIMAATVGNAGYRKVMLKANGQWRFYSVHRLVLGAFVGPAPTGMEVLHSNGDKLDNRLANLRYGTRAENQYDAIRHGTHPWASKTHCPAGHEYSPENTKICTRGDGRSFRACRICRHISNGESRRRRRAIRRAEVA